MKTILFHVNILLAGGIEKVLIELLNGLDPQVYNIQLSIAHNMDELEVLKEKIPAHIKVAYLLDKPVFNNTKKKKIKKIITLPEKIWEDIFLPPFKKAVYRKKLKALVKKADVVIDYDMTLAPYQDVLADKKKVAYCHFDLAQYWGGNKRKLDKLAQRLDHYDKVVMLCDEMKEGAGRLYPFLTHKLIRIYNVVNLERIRELADEPPGEYSDMMQNSYFFSAGRLEETQKDFTTLIKGYALCVKKYGLKENLVIAGQGPDRKKLEQLAVSEGVSGRVIFTGYQENPFNWMKQSKCFLFSSKMEGLPTVLIEALSLGKPIIATCCPTGVAEILMYGKAGTLVEVGNAEAMCKAIHQLYGNTQLQEYYQVNSKQILKEFDIQTEIKQFENMINSL